jgi:hypothetical protein
MASPVSQLPAAPPDPAQNGAAPGEPVAHVPFDPTEITDALTEGCDFLRSAAAAENAEAYQKFASGVLALAQAYVAITTPPPQPPAQQPDNSVGLAHLDAQTKLTIADKQGTTDITKAHIARQGEIKKAEIAADVQRETARISAETQAKAAEKAQQKRVSVKRDNHGQATEYVSH